MMLQPTSGRRGFDYVKVPIDKKLTSCDQEDCQKSTANTSKTINEEQQIKIIEKTADAITKLKE